MNKCEEQYHGCCDEWDRLEKVLKEKDLLNESLKRFALEKVREMHNVWGHVGDFMSCAYGACPTNVKAMARLVDKRKDEQPPVICDCGVPGCNKVRDHQK